MRVVALCVIACALGCGDSGRCRSRLAVENGQAAVDCYQKRTGGVPASWQAVLEDPDCGLRTEPNDATGSLLLIVREGAGARVTMSNGQSPFPWFVCIVGRTAGTAFALWASSLVVAGTAIRRRRRLLWAVALVLAAAGLGFYLFGYVT